MIVTFEQAKRLKKVGYGIMCSHIYADTGALLSRGSSAVMYNRGEEWEAPTVSDSLQWTRDNKGVPCAVELTTSLNVLDDGNLEYVKEGYRGVFLKEGAEINLKMEETFYESESALLDKILDYLESK